MSKDFLNTLDKISLIQFTLLFSLSLFPLIIYKNCSIFTALLISGATTSIYTQLIKLGSFNKIFAFLGFPIRLLITALPCAILVHKLHSNLIALFIGFFLCQVVYFINIWHYSKNMVK